MPKSSPSNTPLFSKKDAARIATAKRFASPPRDPTTVDQQSITSTMGLPNLSNVPLTISPQPVSPLIVSPASPTVTSTSRTKRARPTILPHTPIVSRSGRTVKPTPAMVQYKERLHFFSAESDSYFDDLLLSVVDTSNTFIDSAPTNFANIAKWPDSDKWYDAVAAENDSLARHGVLGVVPSLPAGKNLITAKYVLKRKSDGRYKARLVARGYSQIEGIDYFDVFAPVVSKNTLRLLLSLAAVNDWDINQLDVETAFLYGDLEEEIYMEAPTGSSYPKGTILRLFKSLYGLKQSPRQWNKKLDDFVRSREFVPCKLDPSVYTFGAGLSSVILAIYVDDLLLFGNNADFILDFKLALRSKFTIKDLGAVKDILGMTVTRDRKLRTITLSQSSYLRKLVTKYRLDPDITNSSRSVPMSKTAWLTAIDADHQLAAPLSADLPFRSLLGGILYTNVCCRPDISFAVSALASHCSDPKLMHWNALLNLLKFLRDLLTN